MSREEREFGAEQATDALRRACPGIEVKDVRPLHQGYSGQHWVFGTDEGDLLLRTASPDGPEHLRHLLAATRRAAEAGVPTVRFRSFVPYDDATEGPLLVQEFGPGRSGTDAFPELTTEQRARVGAELGRLVALLHTERGTAYADVLGRDAYPTATDWALSELERCLPIVRDVEIEGSWDELAHRVRLRLEANEPGAPTLLHRDIYFDNVLVVERPEPTVAAILDFERARYGDQFEEFGKLDDVVFGFWPDTREAFLAAYTEVHPIGQGEQHRIHAYIGLYNIVMMAHFFTGTQRQFVPDYVARVATWLEHDRSR